MKMPASWRRILIVNMTVRRSLDRLPPNAPLSTQSEELRDPRMLRIRCMAWAPLLDLNDAGLLNDDLAADRMELDEEQAASHDTLAVESDDRSNFEAQSLPAEVSLTMETQLLAIANDCGHVYVVRVSSPYTTYSNVWGADMIVQCSISKSLSLASLVPQEHLDDDYINTLLPSVQISESRVIARPSLLAVAMSKRKYVEEVLWSPWRVDQSGGTIAGTLTTRREDVFSHHTCLVGVVDGLIQCRIEDTHMRPSDLQNPSPSAAVWFQSVNLNYLSTDCTEYGSTKMKYRCS